MPNLRRRKGRTRDVRVRDEDAGQRPVRDDEPGAGAPRPGKRRARRLRGRGLPKLFLEPLDPYLPARPGSLAALGPLRLTAAGAAVVLAVSSTGHVAVLAVLLAVLVGQPAAVGAVLLAGIALLERWGTPSLDAVAGAQSVLGPGGFVGPRAAAASAWFAALALVLASPRLASDDADSAAMPGPTRRRLPPGGALVAALALGAAAAAAVAGPDFETGGLLRLGATAGAVLVAAVVSSLRWPKVTAGLALIAGVVAAALGVAVATGRMGL